MFLISNSENLEISEIFIIGGYQIYREAVENDLIDKLYITKISYSLPLEKIDTFLPNIDYTKWTLVESSSQYIQPSFIVPLNIKEDIEGSLLANSIRKIEISTNFRIINNNSTQVVYEGSFARNSLVAPIDSLFSRDQSERNARKRLGVSIANDMVVRLIEWAQSS